MSIDTILLILALIAFVAAALPLAVRVNLIAVGLALVTLAQLI